MSTPQSPAPSGRVASLHVHPPDPGAPLRSVQEMEVIKDRGIAAEPRYFDRISGRTGRPGRRQVSLMEREQISEHAAALGLLSIPAGAVRANVETLGVNLIELVGKQVRIGEAILLLYEPRMPCDKMDAICTGLRERMQNHRQGVIAEVVCSGKIRIGDSIELD